MLCSSSSVAGAEMEVAYRGAVPIPVYRYAQKVGVVSLRIRARSPRSCFLFFYHMYFNIGKN